MFEVRLAKERFKFAASHFTIFSESRGERLHGHNYKLEVTARFQQLHPPTGLAA